MPVNLEMGTRNQTLSKVITGFKMQNAVSFTRIFFFHSYFSYWNSFVFTSDKVIL